ncbi:hypothetical protein SVA_2052 [Sulfurifustis variabilis]|uniref:WbqC-like protein n=1 Tax=Sulfurifustis variabilis TaxID=1675686 RepID=A0A1B4VAE3_9GAMM|nr:WbqC family protein [Sulfurifustis variabilis]BAU48604.1 hypothetical protein SVA_2052 [Sulfurifustis variabilis]
MRVGIIQSSYVPWRGFFDFIDSVDLFVVFDDVQYPVGRSWRNRNQLKTKNGLRWLTVPIAAKSTGLAIDEVAIGRTEKPWQDAHRRSLKEALGPAPFFAAAQRLWEEAIAAGDTGISALNVRLIRGICSYLRIETPIVTSREYGAAGRKTERLINLLQAVGASTYLSGPSAKDYLDEAAFQAHRIRLEFKSYDYAEYPQLWGPFVGNVTVLDLIANTGPNAREFLKSRSPDAVAVG